MSLCRGLSLGAPPQHGSLRAVRLCAGRLRLREWALSRTSGGRTTFSRSHTASFPLFCWFTAATEPAQTQGRTHGPHLPMGHVSRRPAPCDHVVKAPRSLSSRGAALWFQSKACAALAFWTDRGFITPPIMSSPSTAWISLDPRPKGVSY